MDIKVKILNDLKKHFNFKSNADFARFLDITPQMLSNWYSRNTFDYEIIYTKCVGVSGDWLLTGKGEMLKNETEPKPNVINTLGAIPLPQSKAIERFWNEQEVPLYELEATAGLQTIFTNQQQNIINFIKIPDLPKCDGAIYARGDSMYPLLKSGDIVVFKEVSNLNYLCYGEMYLVDYSLNSDDYLVIKYIQKSEIDGHIKLVSYNTNHQPLDIPIDSIRAIAIIKASVRLNTLR